MSKHYLEAHIGGSVRNSGFRIVCEDPKACEEEINHKGCFFVQRFNQVGFNLINWPEKSILIGRIEMVPEDWFSPPVITPAPPSNNVTDKTPWPDDLEESDNR
jgi:hypothetical protein